MRVFFPALLLLLLSLLTEDIFCFSKDEHEDIGLVGGNAENPKEGKDANEGGVFHSLFSSVNKLFQNEDAIKKDIEEITSNVKEMKDGIVRNTSNIGKHANMLKENVAKSTNYLTNLFKKTVSDELNHIDKYSKEHLQKLKENAEKKNFLSNGLFDLTSHGHKEDKDKGKDDHGDKTVWKNEGENKIWNFLSGWTKTEGDDGRMKKEKDCKKSKQEVNPFGLFRKDGNKAGNNEDISSKGDTHKSFFFFGRKVSNKEDVKSNVNDHTGKEGETTEHGQRTWSLFNLFSSKPEKGNVEGEREEDTKGNQQSGKSFTFNFFSKETNKESDREEAGSMSPSEDYKQEVEKGRNFFFWDIGTKNDQVSQSSKENTSSEGNQNHDEGGAHWWSGKREVSNGKIEASETGVDATHTIDEHDEGRGGGGPFSLFNLWKGGKKKEEDAQGGDHASTVASTGYDSESAKVREEAEEGFFYKGINNPRDNDTSTGSTDESHTNLMDMMKNYYDDSKNVENDAKLMSLLPAEFPHYEGNVNCHPLVAFKGCLKNCFKGASNEIDESFDSVSSSGRQKRALTLGEYKLLEKCILKCKNSNLDEVTGACIHKDGKVSTSTYDYEEYITNANIAKDTFNKDDEGLSAFYDFTLHDKYSDGENDPSGKNLKTELKSQNYVDPALLRHTTSEEGNNIRSFGGVSNEHLSAHLGDIGVTTNSSSEDPNNSKVPSQEKPFSLFNTFSHSNAMGSSDHAGDSGHSAFSAFRGFSNFGIFGSSKISDDSTLHGKGPTYDAPLGTPLNTSLDETLDTGSVITSDADNDDKVDGGHGYLATGFFLFLLMTTFFVYLSAFTNIINQCFVSFKEKVCVYVKGRYTSPFNNVYEESSEVFLPKSTSHMYHMPNSCNNMYHAFQENTGNVI
ncbi:conserved Plasmodium protein, unknown function [Plasmodium ovale curtisi]|uniref:Uncharacterized protein n=1 Tax=Plasmodium ovale curtisi TaxID=864141 RepID=A0A1A8W771_PLAOA|nr:conserved Plasmodium protein, unknown function [Plasmodium ovale curtisi]SBS99098.1 conserved Plasmodium protein, unknown function [Plasmodium ovale curtisi]